jgi:hypothetical protein
MRSIPKSALTAIGALVLAIGSASATTLPYKSLDRLVAEAEGIVIGTVRQIDATIDERRDIHTYVTFDQLKVIGGHVGTPTLTLRLKGGVAGNERLLIHGSPSFKPDERVLMFIQGNGRDLVPFVGWSQGVFRLVRDPSSGNETVTDGNGAPLLAVQGDHLVTNGATEHRDVQLSGAPDAEKVARAAAAGRFNAGRTDDGSVSTVVDAGFVQGAKAITAEAFVEIVKRRVPRSVALARPLRSVMPGELTEAADEADARPAAIEAVAPSTETLDPTPVAPKRIERAAPRDRQ